MKNQIFTRSKRMLAIVMAVAFSAFSFSANARNTVVDIIVGSEVHQTLENAVIAADLAGTLSGDGPFTIFAPTDAAFEAIGQETLDALLATPEGELTDILLYHALNSKVESGDLVTGTKVATINGKEIEITINDDGVFINDAQVIQQDIQAENGVVHVINAVLLPPRVTVVDIVVGSEVHQTLENAVTAADLAGTLSGDGPFTIFAPTDAAFEAIGQETLDALLATPEGLLTEILTYHVLGIEAESSILEDGMMVETLNGKKVKVSITDGGVFINDAEVIQKDILTDNGVVHVIDAVLLPPADIRTMMNDDYGDIITDADGNTLYFFAKDADGSSACEGGCLDNWPVFYAEDPSVGEGLNADDFGTIDRGEGVMQTTYKGWPLYYFVNDEAPGDVKGEGLINAWFVAKPDYSIMITEAQFTGMDGINYTSEYAAGDEMTMYFTDGMGYTLYTRANDFYSKNKFTAEDFSNNSAWPIYEEDEIVVPSILDAGDFGSIEVFGRTQMTYKGWPLYYFGQDNMMRGSNKGVSVPSPGIWPVAVAEMMAAPYETVVDIVVNSEVHTILETAVIEAGLAGTLSGEGTFTVFAPTDDAFTALGQETIDALLAEPEGDLTDILLYHVLGIEAESSILEDGMMVETLNGKDITVSISEEGVFINDAKVIINDIFAGNGIVHVIDAVMLPPAYTVVDIVIDSEAHDTLEIAVVAAGLASTLAGEGPFTIFAPTDAAFGALPEGTIESLLESPEGALTDILKLHVVPQKAMSSDLSDGDMIETLAGEMLTVRINDEGVFINNAQVIQPDITADNGVVHVVDAVISSTTNIGSKSVEEDMIRIFPNPARDFITFQLKDADFANGTMEIVRIDGVIVNTTQINQNEIRMDLREYESGVYFVRYTQENRFAIERIVLQK